MRRFPRPMRVRDIPPQGLRWETADGAPVSLGDGNALLITGVASELQEITGAAASTNTVRDFAPAERYRERVLQVPVPGAAGLEVPESTLSFRGCDGRCGGPRGCRGCKLDPGAFAHRRAHICAGQLLFRAQRHAADRPAPTRSPFCSSPLAGPRRRQVPWRVAEGFRVELVAEANSRCRCRLAAVPQTSLTLRMRRWPISPSFTASVKALGKRWLGVDVCDRCAQRAA